MQEPRVGRLRVARTAHFAETGLEPGTPGELWIVLHGYGQRAPRFLRRFAAIAAPPRRIVAPEGLSRFYRDTEYRRVGASWMTREDRDAEIDDTVAWLDALVDHLHERDGRPTRTVVLGFSQGAPAAGRWLARGRHRANRLICWGAGLPHDVDLGAHRDLFGALDLTLVLGEQDRVVPPGSLDEQLRSLEAARIPHRVVRYQGGHDLDADVLVRLANAGD